MMRIFLFILFFIPQFVVAVPFDSPFADQVADFVHFGLSIKKDQFGKPLRIESQKVENEYVTGQIDERQTIIFEGITFFIYKVNSNPPTVLVGRVVLTKPLLKLPYSIQIGSTKEDIKKALGVPDEENDDAMVYEMEACQVEMSFQKGHLIKLDWTDNA